MSKFRDTPPQAPGDKVIPFPAGGEMTLEQRKAELDAFRSAADAELSLRLKYSILKRTLASIDDYEPVPDDWRAKLLAREPSHAVDLDGEEADHDEDEDDEDL